MRVMCLDGEVEGDVVAYVGWVSTILHPQQLGQMRCSASHNGIGLQSMRDKLPGLKYEAAGQPAAPMVQEFLVFSYAEHAVEKGRKDLCMEGKPCKGGQRGGAGAPHCQWPCR